MRILVVEDDQSLRNAIITILEDEGFRIDHAGTGDDGLYLAEQGIYDVIVLDIMLPGIDGISIIKELRTQGVATPVIFLTAKDSVESRVKGLDAGADDYLVKPFAIEELLARIRALLRRNGKIGEEQEISYGPITISLKEHDGFVQNHPLKLTAKEYELLEYLIRNKEQILTREQIFNRIWGIDSDKSEGIVELYIHYIRKKLAAFGCDSVIRTIRSIGYMLKEDSEIVS
ncbi:response regulator transcription factor [Fodinisporobacter ferrooxydans]|uniref:Response regulator transcription factor n=1 Tax=Fodinisporobacter ferrooxydans TaxID=2901836 RepID=A0ABY4CDK6_9BACL|nr:response regulator transcription factor [Alicyclobacillaceae bacterium MYW30-H2]